MYASVGELKKLGKSLQTILLKFHYTSKPRQVVSDPLSGFVIFSFYSFMAFTRSARVSYMGTPKALRRWGAWCPLVISTQGTFMAFAT